jgi:protein-L-isoaspartate(D-aspartate) O-methyltransferase
MAASALDQPLPLDADSAATVSAPHAYLLTFALLDLDLGDRLLELGTGSGYGAALARHIVGEGGWITSVEIDPALHARARRLVGGAAELVLGDGGALASELSRARRTTKVAFTYALARDPAGALEALAPGGVVVAPVAASHAPAGAAPQEIVRFTRAAGGAVVRTAHGGVLYVAERRL